MKKVYEMALVDQTRCIGDKICENVCPAEAIRMVEKKAQVDESKCVACFKCIDVCNEAAIRPVPRVEARILSIDPMEVDQTQLRDLCRRANMDPEEPICLCTLTQAKEVAAAILKGAGSPEEVTRMTGKPGLLLDTDHGDPRLYQSEQIKSRIDAYLEMLG